MNRQMFVTIMRNALCLFILMPYLRLQAQSLPLAKADSSDVLVYKINIKEDIMPAAWRQVKRGLADAQEQQADLVLLHLNTYGGMVNMADSIRTGIINCPIPVWAFIDNQAASAGALISIACDRIYMRRGGSIGAATVVNQTGEVQPDKYQSFMRSMMRATAESHGCDTLINAKGDTSFRWLRDPRIAEAMVDPSIYIEGIIDTGKVLTFTADEAMAHGYCEGKAENVAEVLKNAGIEHYTITEQHITALDRIVGLLTNPTVSGVLIMLIVGGLYFELQTPGVGFPLMAAAIAAMLYFAPLYIDGLAQYWELALFVVGIVLLLVEVLVIPGFGVAGVSGIVLVVVGLTLAMVDNDLFRDFDGHLNLMVAVKPLCVVLLGLFVGLVAAIYLSQKFFTSNFLPGISKGAELTEADGYIGIDTAIKGKDGAMGVALSVLRPSGKVEIAGDVYDAVAAHGFIEKGRPVRVLHDEAGQLYVVEAEA